MRTEHFNLKNGRAPVYCEFGDLCSRPEGKGRLFPFKMQDLIFDNADEEIGSQ